MKFDTVSLNMTRPYLVDGLIPREGLIVLWGPPKCGKTFFTLDLVMHVALGWPYRDRKVEQGTVVYIACEGERGLRARIVAFRKHHLDGGFIDRNLSPPFYLLATQLDLVKEVGNLRRALAQQIPEGPVGCIVIDTLNRSISGSENDDEDMRAYLDAANELREQFNCVVIMIHHCGVDGTRPRGHTSLTGTIEAQLAIKRNDSKQIISTVEFMKDGVEGERIVSRLDVIEVGKDEDGEPLTSCVVTKADEEVSHDFGSRPGKKLTPALKIAMDQLDCALTEEGDIPPATKGVPSVTMCVQREVWRQYAYNGGIGDGDGDSDEPASAATRRQAFHRAAKRLIADGLVGQHGEYVWIKNEFS